MKQRALQAGVLANPYRYIESGQVFEHHQAMNWAEPVEDQAVEPEPAGGEADAAPAPGRRKRAAPAQPAGGEADPI